MSSRFLSWQQKAVNLSIKRECDNIKDKIMARKQMAEKMETASLSSSDDSSCSSTDDDYSVEKKTVSFNPKVKVRIPKHIKEITVEEQNLIWYCDEEFELMKKDTKETLAELRRVGSLNEKQIEEEGPIPEDFCIRGLEWKTPQGLRTLLTRKKKASMALLNEQQRQRDNGDMEELDDDLIAKAYAKATRRSVQEALRRGKQDEKTAKSTEDHPLLSSFLMSLASSTRGNAQKKETPSRGERSERKSPSLRSRKRSSPTSLENTISKEGNSLVIPMAA